MRIIHVLMVENNEIYSDCQYPISSEQIKLFLKKRLALIIFVGNSFLFYF